MDLSCVKEYNSLKLLKYFRRKDACDTKSTLETLEMEAEWQLKDV